ncbi:hypothetical protein DYQ48_00670 [Xanthomonas hortorum]|nr:hypothetical protein [Xanthomonas hortorum pv. vitians]NMI36615.1 hypothetical protein [Xanthomonas hortorum pv. vitians]QEW13763.1 hypothetical protein DYQ48_00670 [Xanthomonas hortorum]
MPRKSLQGRTSSVSCDGGRARTLQQTHSVEVAATPPHPTVCWLFIETMRTDHPDWSLPAYCRGTLRGMDAA